MQLSTNLNRLMRFTWPLVIGIVIASLGGLLFENNIYGREAPVYAAQGVATDLFNLVVFVPALVISAHLVRRGLHQALFVWLGGIMYVMYIYGLYCFSVHFNSLFLVYCAVLGLSFYALLTALLTLRFDSFKNWFEGTATTPTTIFLAAVAVMFYLLWFFQVLPSVLEGTLRSEANYFGFITDYVVIQDTAFLLPALLVGAWKLRRKQAFGYLLAPSLLLFITWFSGAGILMAVAPYVRMLNAAAEPIFIFCGLTIISIALFITGWLRKRQTTEAPLSPS